MKKIISILILFISLNVFAQKPKADVYRYSKITTTERDLLSPETTNIWFIYNETNQQFEFFNGTSWTAVDTSSVLSVAGKQGAVTLDLDDVADSATRKALTTGSQTIEGQKTLSEILNLEKSLLINKTATTKNESIGVDVTISTSGEYYVNFINGIRTVSDNLSYLLGNVVRLNNSNNDDWIGIKGSESNVLTTGSGSGVYIIGSDNKINYNGSGVVTDVSGSINRAIVGGTGASSVVNLVGSLGSAKIQNPNTNIQNLKASSSVFDLDNGSVVDGYINHLEFDYTAGNAASIDLTNLYYIYAANDVLPTISGEKFFIKAETTLPSEFAGDLSTLSDLKTNTLRARTAVPLSIQSNTGVVIALFNPDNTSEFRNNVTVIGSATGTRFISTQATGTAPLTVSSTTKVVNLNADKLDDLDSIDFARKTGTTPQTITPQTTFADNVTLSGNLSVLTFYDTGELQSGTITYDPFATEFISSENIVAPSIISTGNIEGVNFKTDSLTFATLPASPIQGWMRTITDASAITYRAIASGGGTDFALVVYDGTNWIYH